MSTAWPYDADRDDPLTTLRIPVASAWADWNYIVAFDKESAVRPDSTEARQLASCLRYYIDSWYTESYKARLAERPFDIDGGANGLTFHKYGPGDWGYRRRTWTMGPLYVPQSPRLRESARLTIGPLPLEQVMDRAYGHRDRPHARRLGLLTPPRPAFHQQGDRHGP
ncbi:hypothetical protein OG552_10725 [Streptomyces sp. NBC_01476]|uniref:hypothetical protein n=1 Tax=Streptomyces sp. NBC_01476 TaxID=2903881 RepID=UPI002E2EE02B|nr:hypothetical protein [Streptomyces sp. NBC_01476]